MRLTRMGPIQYTTLFLQMTHARHHTIASPMMHCMAERCNQRLNGKYLSSRIEVVRLTPEQ